MDEWTDGRTDDCEKQKRKFTKQICFRDTQKNKNEELEFNFVSGCPAYLLHLVVHSSSIRLFVCSFAKHVDPSPNPQTLIS